MFDPVSFGIMTAASGGLQAIGKFQSGQAQARAQNQAAVNQYKQKLKIRERNWARDNMLYSNKLAQYKEQLGYNSAAASRAYATEQIKLNELLKSQAFKSQDAALLLAQRGGAAAASGKTGSSRRSDLNIQSQFVRNQGVREETFRSAYTAADRANRYTADKLAMANRKAFVDVGPAPMADLMPLKPVQRSGPSTLSLVGDLAGAAVSGVSAYGQAKAGEWFKD